MSRKKIFLQFMEDWAYLACLGIVLAILSFIVDKGIIFLEFIRMFMFELSDNPGAQYLGWMTTSVVCVLFATGFVQLVCPLGVGSGIPEMKTILRGIEMKGYLTFKILVAKVIGLTATLGSGMPLGKEGPFVHIGGISAQLVSNVFNGIRGKMPNVRNYDMLAAGCGVGISACFASPVGGMLFSIEVTSTYFAVRNYWKRYFGALWAAIMFRLLAVWSHHEETIRPLFATSFPEKYSYNTIELFFFAIIGICCGLMGAFFVFIHRKWVRMIKYNRFVAGLFAKNFYIYPFLGAFVVSTLTFPNGFGQFIASDLPTHHQMLGLFDNLTWSKDNHTDEEMETVQHWTVEGVSVIVNLACFFVYHYIFTMICYTFPIPCGAFIPALKIGAGFGRLFGEIIALIYPEGIINNGVMSMIVPGGYAIVGAAAFSGAVTRSIAVTVIVFELTGQLTHLIPVMIATLIAYSIQAMFESSLYDSIIMQKKLPYLPDLLPSGSGMHSIFVEHFTNREVVFVSYGITYGELKDILRDNPHVRYLPLVDNQETRILLGSIQRRELIKTINNLVGREKRLAIVAKRRNSIASSQIIHHRRKSSSVGDLSHRQIQKLQNQMEDDSLKQRTLPKDLPSSLDTSTESKKGANNKGFKSSFISVFKRTKSTEPNEFGSFILDKEYQEETKKSRIVRIHGGDMSPQERRTWEAEQLTKFVDFSSITIDPAPVQLIERTSLSKVHSLFSMIGIDYAFVTNLGKLVGVVGLTDLKKAIDDVNAGNYENFLVPTPEAETPLLQRSYHDKNYSHENTITSIQEITPSINLRASSSKETII